MSSESDVRTERYVEGVRENYELVDVMKETGSVKNIEGFAVDADEEVLAVTYKDGTAELVPFGEFDNGEIGVILNPKVLSLFDNHD